VSDTLFEELSNCLTLLASIVMTSSIQCHKSFMGWDTNSVIKASNYASRLLCTKLHSPSLCCLKHFQMFQLYSLRTVHMHIRGTCFWSV